MSDHEAAGFKVVDRRQAAAAPTADAGATAPESTHPGVSDAADTADSPAEPAAHVADTGASPPAESREDQEQDQRSLPDPTLLLSIASMQLDVTTLAQALLPVFDGQAWRAMGFVADPRTGEATRDLPSAQLAIDCVQFLLGKVEQKLEDGERREIHRRLNDLRMNYLSKLREG